MTTHKGSRSLHPVIASVVAEFGHGAITAWRKTEDGRVNENWIVKTADSQLVVRRLAQGRPLSEIQYEHAFINGLGRSGLPYKLPIPLISKSGDTVLFRDGAYIWAYEYIEGQTSLACTQQRREYIATAMASVHKAARRINIPFSKTIPLAVEDTWLLEAIQECKRKIADSSDDRLRYFLDHADECISALEGIRYPAYGTLPRFPIHSDWNMLNVVFAGDELTGIIDFDNCRCDTAIRDVTTFLQQECLDAEESFKLDLPAARQFLRCYNRHLRVSRKETDMIAGIMIAECADEFWWNIYRIVHNRNAAIALRHIENPFRTLCWCRDNQLEISRSLHV